MGNKPTTILISNERKMVLKLLDHSENKHTYHFVLEDLVHNGVHNSFCGKIDDKRCHAYMRLVFQRTSEYPTLYRLTKIQRVEIITYNNEDVKAFVRQQLDQQETEIRKLIPEPFTETVTIEPF